MEQGEHKADHGKVKKQGRYWCYSMDNFKNDFKPKSFKGLILSFQKNSMILWDYP